MEKNKSREFYNILENNPIIAAVKDMDGLQKCVKVEEIKVIFILFGNICTIKDIVAKIKEYDKTAMIHIDLITGLSAKEEAVTFIKENTLADGIITTKTNLIRRAKELSLYTVLRVFIIDSMALKNIKEIEHSNYNTRPDFIEILPGAMPKIIGKIRNEIRIPIIAGGLVADREDVINALEAGAVSISTTNESVWHM